MQRSPLPDFSLGAALGARHPFPFSRRRPAFVFDAPAILFLQALYVPL
jgi:hypothetical protein